ncbi:MmcQ/YjbR family DNA-binding protein [Porphyromonas pogonae]|uniref:MmcQ/YjbR family DNA-binding protein n=1 Tax=Porphyromonas pogonae TaxID=867595 RepID=UPI002E762FC4|nr:MmcQ/YjbR family DNA-binding protein [Porphyromonas pogonae]
MDIEQLREACISLPHVEETFPFDEVTLVFKVGGKMFALTPLDTPEHSVSLKCDPDYALELRDRYESVRSAFHMNKKHWNNIILNGDVPDKLLLELIRHSYDRVVEGLTRKEKEKIKSKSPEV